MEQVQQHWEHIYTGKAVDAVSWFQPQATRSLSLIQAGEYAHVIDVGGGASRLVDGLLATGCDDVTVLDIAAQALAHSKARLGTQAASVHWRVGDVRTVQLPAQAYDVWHDRAVFHFLTDAGDRKHYIEQLTHAVVRGGRVIIATFAAEDGPLKCSGLPVVRYSPQSLAAELGAGFELVDDCRETHHTPFDTTQAFIYAVFRKR